VRDKTHPRRRPRGHRLLPRRTAAAGQRRGGEWANGRRHAELADADLITAILSDLGLAPGDIGTFVLDGWGRQAATEGVRVRGSGGIQIVRTAPYRRSDDQAPPLHRYRPPTPLVLAGTEVRYVSYRHVEAHVASAYLTSAQARAGKPSLVLVWDGGVFPELYLVQPEPGRVRHLGHIFGIPGSVYSGFCCNVDPFRPDPDWTEDQHRDFHLTMPGRAMAYAGLGRLTEEFIAGVLTRLAELDGCWDAPARIYPAVEPAARRLGLSGADVLAGFQEALARRLVAGLAAARERLPEPVSDLCFAGGSALNIKWNSAIRASGLFASVWAPPCPNDSGAAIGAACAELMASGTFAGLDWSVYSGAALTAAARPAGWLAAPCSTDQLGGLLHDTGEPVVVLGGRAELGPRALGHRSILASPASASVKRVLNEVKGSEDYRPVAPMCLEQFAAEIFEPGGPDPYMLFDHRVRPWWAGRIPAVIHVDGTARLQTVNDRDAPLAAAVVRAFWQRSVGYTGSVQHQRQPAGPGLLPGCGIGDGVGRRPPGLGRRDPVHQGGRSLSRGRPAGPGLAVAIDVIRAFTTAAILLSRGATELICVRSFAEVRAVTARMPAALVAGEQRDPPFPRVDLPNSPVAAATAEVTGRPVVFCTVNGTRVLAAMPRSVIAVGCAAVNVSASAAWILDRPESWPVHLVCTDPDAGEDRACASHLAALLRGEAPDPYATRCAVIAAAGAHERQWRDRVPEDLWRGFLADVDVCAQVDAVPVVLACSRDDAGLMVMRNGAPP